MITDDWHGLYRAGWKNLIVDDAFQHPAKFARKLIKQIYEHCLVCHWLNPGDVIIDPFGGVALGGLDAMRIGLDWIGVELEPKFVDLGNRNIALWNERYSDQFMRWGTARLLQGDSRRLLEVIAGADACVSSPPYNGKSQEGKVVERDRRRLTAMGREDLIKRLKTEFRGSETYGDTPGQLAALREGDLDAAISSPPYAESLSRNHYGDGIDWDKAKTGAGARHQLPGQSVSSDYGNMPGNIGVESGDTFWKAAHVIVAQTFAALRSGGHAVWVVKSFVRNGQLVDFPDQWRRLCESVGFETLHIHRAWMVEDHGMQLAIDGNHKRECRERKSFFRRLAEKKGSPRIDFEIVLCLVKP